MSEDKGAIVNFSTGRKPLTPQEILDNATEEGQTKVIVASMDDKGNVAVYSTDMMPMEELYLVSYVKDTVGMATLQGRNAKFFPDWYEE